MARLSIIRVNAKIDIEEIITASNNLIIDCNDTQISILNIIKLNIEKQITNNIKNIAKLEEPKMRLIDPDDILIVDRSLTPSHKDIVIAVLDGDLTVKELCIEGGKVSLIPRNKKMKPIVIQEGQELLVWGVVTSSIHRFKR